MTQNTINTEADTFGDMKSKLGFTTNQEVLDYIFYLNMQNANDGGKAKLVYGVDSPIVNLGSSGKGYF